MQRFSLSTYRRNHPAIWSSLAIAVFTACARPSTDLIHGRVSCKECTIKVERIAVIGAEAEKASLNGRPTGVWLDDRGVYWINVMDAFPMTYDPVGERLDQFGKAGGGPGEFKRPAFRSYISGDSMLLSDFATFQIIGPDRTVARTLRRVPDVLSIAVIHWPTDVLAITTPHDPVSSTVRTLVGKYNFAADSAVMIDTVLDTGPNSGHGAEWANSHRRFGLPTPDGDIWISDYNRYRLVRYSVSGAPQDSIIRRPRWFPGGTPIRLGGPNEASSPHIIGNWADSSGLVWVFVAQPRKNTHQAWQNVSTNRDGVSESRMSSLPAEYKLYQTVIEVVDPSIRRVVIRYTFDGYIISILPGQQVASYVESDLGIPVLRIDHLTLLRPRA